MAIVPWVPISGSFGSLPALTGVTSGTAAPEDTITTPDGYDPADPDDIWDEFPEDQAATADSGYLPIVVVPPYSLAEPLTAVTLSGGTVEVLGYSLTPVATTVTGVTLSGGTITQTIALDLPAAGVAVAGVAPEVVAPIQMVVDLPAAASSVDAIVPEVFVITVIALPTASAVVEPIPPEAIGSSIVDVPAAGVTVNGAVPAIDVSAVLLLLHFDGSNGATTSTDSGPNGFAITHVSSAQLSTTAPLMFGPTYVNFNGSNQAVDTNASSLLSLPGPFCVDCRVYATTSTGLRSIFELGVFSDGILLRAGATDGSLFVNNTVVGGSGAVHSNLAYNTWVHAAVTRDESNGVRLFLDGIQIGSTATVSGTVNSGEQRLRIANINHTTPGQFLGGRIDEFRIVKGSAVWTANFTPPTAAYD